MIGGEIKIDGHNLREIKLSSLRQAMGIVPQETVLFRGTIAENIAYGKMNAAMEEIIAAAKASNALAHRLSTIRSVNRIAVMQGGKLWRLVHMRSY